MDDAYTVKVTALESGEETPEQLQALKSGDCFLVADGWGDLREGAEGLFDNDTRILFATAYDGDWDTYINDFATKIPDLMDLLFASVEGWPGIASPKVKDFIAEHQITAAGWFVANPQVTVVDVRRLQRMEHAVNEFLDKVG